MTQRLDFIIAAQNQAMQELVNIRQELTKMTDAVKQSGQAAASSAPSFGTFFSSFTAANLATNALMKLKDIALALPVAAVQLATAQEQTNIAFTTMIGNASVAQTTLKELYSFAAKTPFTITGIEQSSKLLMAMGISVDELQPTLKSLGDVAAGVSVPIEQVALAYGQVRAANQLYGTELRQFVNAGIPILGQLAKQFGVNEAAMKKMVEEGKVGFKDVEKAFQGMSGEGGRFFNLMDKQSKTVAGKWSNLKDQATILGRNFGSVLTPAIGTVTDFLIEEVTAMNSWLYTSEGQLRPEVVEFGNSLKDLAGFLTTTGKAMIWLGEQAVNLMQILDQQSGFSSFRGMVKDWYVATNTDQVIANIEAKSSQTIADMMQKRLEQVRASNAEVSAAALEGGGGGGGGGSSTAAKEAEKLQDAIDDLASTYTDLSDTVGIAMNDVRQNTSKALDELESQMTDIRSEMESLSATFLEEQAGGRQDLASAYVEQEAKVKELHAALVELKNAETPDEERISQKEAEYEKELAALEEFSTRTQDIQAEIEEARRRASLTDFQKTVEDIDAEQKAKEDAFTAEMQQLADKLVALEEQKLKIQDLESKALLALTNLSTYGASIYGTFIDGIKTKTQEDVTAMIKMFDDLAARMAKIGGTAPSGELSPYAEQYYGTQLTNAANQGSVNVGGITVTMTVNGAENAQDVANQVAQTVIDQLTNKLQTLNAGSQ